LDETFGAQFTNRFTDDFFVCNQNLILTMDLIRLSGNFGAWCTHKFINWF